MSSAVKGTIIALSELALLSKEQEQNHILSNLIEILLVSIRNDSLSSKQDSVRLHHLISTFQGDSHIKH